MTQRNHVGKIVLTLFAATALFSACSKDDDNSNVNPDAVVKIVNVLPDAGSVDVYNGSSKLNSSTIAYGAATGYLNAKNGDATYDFKSSVSGNTVLSAPVKFSGGSYSLFAAGVTGNNTTVGILAQDDLKAPSANKAKIRFVHASSDAPAQNFLANDSLIYTATAYKTVTDFKEITAGTYTIKLNDATAGTTTISQANVVLTAGKIYTIVAQGLANPTPVVQQGLSLAVYGNN
jgi:hypothetical protein